MRILVILSAFLGLALADNTTEDGSSANRANIVADVYLRFYNGTTFGEYVDVRLFNATDLLEVQGFNTSYLTLVYIFGYTETPDDENVQTVMSAYLQARPDINKVLLDWSNMAGGDYILNAAPNTKKVGVAAAEQLWPLLQAGVELHVVGHSLGGQVAGYLTRELQQQFGYTVGRLTALDPAYPGFYPDGLVLEHVSADDAAFVDVIHTDAGNYGAPVSTGSADFWPNNGKGPQPGCPLIALVPLSNDSLCSHWRSWRYYAESVLQPDAFPASPASSYQQFLTNDEPKHGYVYMGINADSSANGSYYLTTNAESPYGRGIARLEAN